tara:strand:- start:1795 stop:1986 length:192 start_codon:yes stop_codon:yes gene_type:complete
MKQEYRHTKPYRGKDPTFSDEEIAEHDEWLAALSLSKAEVLGKPPYWKKSIVEKTLDLLKKES